MERNKVMFRIENTDDRFDFELEKPKYIEFNLIEYLNNFYKKANEYNSISFDKNSFTFEINEFDISNNMLLSEMEERKSKK